MPSVEKLAQGSLTGKAGVGEEISEAHFCGIGFLTSWMDVVESEELVMLFARGTIRRKKTATDFTAAQREMAG